MSNIQKFLSALKRDFNDLFVVKEGAPIGEFWEAYDLAVMEAIQLYIQADLPKTVEKCSFDPSNLTDVPLGMFHCPECGKMVVAGMPHPDYDALEAP